MKNKKKFIIICVSAFIFSGILAFFISNSLGLFRRNDKNSEPEITDENPTLDETQGEESESLVETQPEETETLSETPPIESENCSTSLGRLMLINPNFIVDTNYISARKSQLVNITDLYGIREGNAGNGVPLLDAEAARHLNDMLTDYKLAYPGHEMTTRSCFRSVGTNCGRLCYATGTSDHHTGYTCDLVDDYYGDSLDTDLYLNHPEWQWLHENSYKYGFIDRFIEEWAGGSMLEPVNVDANGTTGLFETWHYRYVGLSAAEEIASGKYNGGNYDSLEHYLKASGRIRNLLDRTSCN